MTMRFFALLQVLILASLAALAPAAARANDAVAQGAYRITFLGIPFGTTQYRGTFDAATYAAEAHFVTSGLVSIFWKAVIDATVNGAYDANHVRPALYDADYRGGKDKHQRVKLTYNGSEIALFADPAYDTTRYPITDAQKAEAVDPMSAVTLILLGLTADPANPCGTVAPVYDGRRRYDIELAYIRDEHVKLAGKLYDGPAHLCQIRYKQIAGYKQKILDEGKRWPLIYGYFADVPSTVAPAGRYVAALKVWSDTTWGTLAVTLVERDLKETAAP